LPKRWVAILIPFTGGVLLAVVFARSFGYNDAIAGFVGGVIMGAASLPIVVSAKQHGTGREEREVKSDTR